MNQDSVAQAIDSDMKIGWMGTGRMGFAMAARLLAAGCNVAVYNRTRSKAEPLAEKGAVIVDVPAEIADRDIVFTMVSGPADLRSVVSGDNGLLSSTGSPQLLIDCSSVSADGSAEVRNELATRGTAMLSAPVSGNAKVVTAGLLTLVVSGPKEAFTIAEPYLNTLGTGVTYVGDAELARMVKICHNVLLGVVTQCMAEITVLAEKGGVPRHALLEFINNSAKILCCRPERIKSRAGQLLFLNRASNHDATHVELFDCVLHLLNCEVRMLQGDCAQTDKSIRVLCAQLRNFFVLYQDNFRSQVRIGPMMILTDMQTNRLHINSLVIHLLQSKVDIVDIDLLAQWRSFNNGHEVTKIFVLRYQRPDVMHVTVCVDIHSQHSLAIDHDLAALACFSLLGRSGQTSQSARYK